MNESTPAVELHDLTKDFGCGHGIFNVHLCLAPGESMGFLGANGAGKTTVMRLLMGLIRPDTGRASIYGFNCFDERPQMQSLIGYLPGEALCAGYCHCSRNPVSR